MPTTGKYRHSQHTLSSPDLSAAEHHRASSDSEADCRKYTCKKLLLQHRERSATLYSNQTTICGDPRAQGIRILMKMYKTMMYSMYDRHFDGLLGISASDTVVLEFVSILLQPYSSGVFLASTFYFQVYWLDDLSGQTSQASTIVSCRTDFAEYDGLVVELILLPVIPMVWDRWLSRAELQVRCVGVHVSML